MKQDLCWKHTVSTTCFRMSVNSDKKIVSSFVVVESRILNWVMWNANLSKKGHLNYKTKLEYLNDSSIWLLGIPKSSRQSDHCFQYLVQKGPSERFDIPYRLSLKLRIYKDVRCIRVHPFIAVCLEGWHQILNMHSGVNSAQRFIQVVSRDCFRPFLSYVDFRPQFPQRSTTCQQELQP